MAQRFGRTVSVDPEAPDIDQAALRRELSHLLAQMLVADFRQHGFLAGAPTGDSPAQIGRSDSERTTS